MDQARAKEYREAINLRHKEELRAFRLYEEDPGAPEECRYMEPLEKFEYIGRRLDAYSQSSLVDRTRADFEIPPTNDAYSYSPEPMEETESYSLPEIVVEPAFGNFGPLTLKIDVACENGILQNITAWWAAEFIPLDMFARLDASVQSGPPSSHGIWQVDRDIRMWEEAYRTWYESANASPKLIKTLHQLMHSVEVYEACSVIQPDNNR